MYLYDLSVWWCIICYSAPPQSPINYRAAYFFSSKIYPYDLSVWWCIICYGAPPQSPINYGSAYFFPKFIRMIYPYGGVSFIVVPHPSPLLHRSTRHVTQAQAHGSRGGTRLVALARTHAASQKHRTELNQVVSNYLQNEKKPTNNMHSETNYHQEEKQITLWGQTTTTTAPTHYELWISNIIANWREALQLTHRQPFESNELKFHHAKGNGILISSQTAGVHFNGDFVEKEMSCHFWRPPARHRARMFQEPLVILALFTTRNVPIRYWSTVTWAIVEPSRKHENQPCQ